MNIPVSQSWLGTGWFESQLSVETKMIHRYSFKENEIIGKHGTEIILLECIEVASRQKIYSLSPDIPKHFSSLKICHIIKGKRKMFL